MTTPAVVANKARVPKRWELSVQVGEDVPPALYQGHTSAIEWPTNQSAYTWRGGDDNTITDVADGDQVCNITVAQDFTAGSLYRVMREHAGKRATLRFYPDPEARDFGVQSEITLMRPPLTVNKAGQIIEHTIACPSSVPVDIDDAA